MEDLIGFLIFVFFIISRVKKDRDRGMNREPSQNASLPGQEYSWEPSYEPEPQREIEYWEEPEPADLYGQPVEQGSLLDGYESEEKAIEVPITVPLSFAGMNLRQAVIWTEILQKPKALQRRGAFGHRYGI